MRSRYLLELHKPVVSYEGVLIWGKRVARTHGHPLQYCTTKLTCFLQLPVNPLSELVSHNLYLVRSLHLINSLNWTSRCFLMIRFAIKVHLLNKIGDKKDQVPSCSAENILIQCGQSS
jgi:hypothetical protein